MSKTVLLTIGRMPKALEVARALSAAGHRVVVADPFAWHICRISRAVARSYTTVAPNVDGERYLADLLRIVHEERVDVVVPLSEETMHVVGLQGRLPAHVTLYTSDRDLVRTLHDKRRFNALVTSLGLSAPETFPLEDPRAHELAQRAEVVVKPVFSCAGMGVQLLERGAELPAPGAPNAQLVQTRVRGVHRSSFTVAREGAVLATVVYEGTVFQGTVSTCFRRVDDSPAIVAWIKQFVRATQYQGFVSFDFIVDADGTPYAIECNPRATSGVHFLEPLALAHAMIPPEGAPAPVSIPYRAQRLFQQLYTTLTETQRAMFTGRQFRDKLQQLFAARDVVWSRSDPLPFLLMTPVAYQILAMSIFEGIPMGEAATRDIGWFHERPPSVPESVSSTRPLAVHAE
jgi:predicted ATP-grasp superfamily ATP-dependent carboligase